MSARTEKLNRRLEELSARVAAAEGNPGAKENPLEKLSKRSETLWKRSDIVLRRLAVAERELEIWRFMAWLERARPASERLISVITPTRNRAEILERCVDSVLAQAHTTFELLVVDDGSEDETPDLLARCTDPRVRPFRTEHVGVSAARNHGLERATGSVVAYLDDDNIMDPLWLMAVARAYDQRPETPILYGARLDDWNATGRLPVLRLERFDRKRLEMENIADTNVIAHRRDHPEAHFDEEFSFCADWDLMLRLTRGKPPYVLPAIACDYSTQAPARLSDRPIGALREEQARVIAKHATSAGQQPRPARDGRG